MMFFSESPDVQATSALSYAVAEVCTAIGAPIRIATEVNVRVGDRNHRNPGYVMVTPHTLMQNTLVLFHEATHEAHITLQPDLFAQYGQNMEATNGIELVAELGGLIFQEEHHDYLDDLRDLMQDELPDIPEYERTQAEWERLDRNHRGGSSAAEFLFEHFGSKYFRAFAHMNAQGMKNALKRLGHTDPLYIPIGSSQNLVDRLVAGVGSNATGLDSVLILPRPSTHDIIGPKAVNVVKE